MDTTLLILVLFSLLLNVYAISKTQQAKVETLNYIQDIYKHVTGLWKASGESVKANNKIIETQNKIVNQINPRKR